MSKLVLQLDQNQQPTDINNIELCTPIGNTIGGYASHIAKVTIAVNGGPSEQSGYYTEIVALCDGSHVQFSKGPLDARQRGMLEVGSKWHAEQIMAGLQIAIKMGWLK